MGENCGVTRNANAASPPDLGPTTELDSYLKNTRDIKMAVTHLVNFQREVVREHLSLLFQKLNYVFSKSFLGAIFLCPAALGTV